MQGPPTNFNLRTETVRLRTMKNGFVTEGGSGIGLAIAKALTARVRGKVLSERRKKNSCL